MPPILAFKSTELVAPEVTLTSDGLTETQARAGETIASTPVWGSWRF